VKCKKAVKMCLFF